MHPKLNGLFALSLVSLFCSQPTLADSPFLTSGIDAFKKGNYSEALGLLGAAKPLEFDNPVWHYYMANSLFKLNQKAEAIKEYKLAFDLAPQGQLKQYCQSALQSLDPSYAIPAKRETGEPAKSEVKNPMNRIPVIASQRPQVVSVVCGCPLCRRLDMMMTDLQYKYGDRVKFTRTQMPTPGTREGLELDSHLTEFFQKYSVQKCPTVMVFNNQGAMQHVFTEFIPAEDLMKVVDEVAKASPATQFTKMDDDDKIASQRKTIVDDLNGKVAEDQLRLDEEIKQIEKDADVQPPDQRVSVGRRGRGVYGQDQQVQNNDYPEEVKNKIRALRDDSDRRKREWTRVAEEKIHALESIQTSKKPAANTSAATPR